MAVAPKPTVEDEREFWTRVHAYQEKVYNDPKRWAKHQEEMAAWDATLEDGLFPEDEEDLAQDADQQGD